MTDKPSLLRTLSLAALAACALAPASNAADEFPAINALQDLVVSEGFRMNGILESFTGYVAAPIGDINGDGVDDLAIGAPYDADYVSKVHVVFGKAGGLPLDVEMSSLNGSNGFTLVGEAAGDLTGSALADGGDINGDGLGDLIVGAWRASPDGVSSGKAYVVFGRTSFASEVNLSTINGANGFVIAGNGDNTRLGVQVAGLGDTNGDGYDDILAGAPGFDVTTGNDEGAAFVVFGGSGPFSASRAATSLSVSEGFRLAGATGSSRTGEGVGAAGDVNGDGLKDMVVGAPGAAGGGTSRGTIYIVFGSSSVPSTSVNLGTLATPAGFRIDGAADGDGIGLRVAGAGDVNGDGFDEVIIGVPDGGSGGQVFLYFGHTVPFVSTSLVTLTADQLVRIDSPASGVDAGYSVAGAGDVDGDGFFDIAIGAPRADFSGANAGSTYVVLGHPGTFPTVTHLSSLATGDGFRLDGGDVGELNGAVVATAGDMNADGIADLVSGAVDAEPHGNDSGRTYVFYGRVPVDAVSRTGATADQYITGGNLIDTLSGLDGDDELEGRGSGDILVGGNGKDAASYRNATAGVKASLATPSDNSGDASGDSYTTIENLTGSGFADTLIGNSSGNVIEGGRGNDSLKGKDGKDTLVGGLGKDTLRGNDGKDTFVYRFVNESPKGDGRDVIKGFKAGSKSTAQDVIDLSAIDAKEGKPGNQSFKFIGNKKFSKKEGQLRYSKSGKDTIIHGDTDGDGKAEFQIELRRFSNTSGLTEKDFKL